jgi:hypothetical protein
MISLPAGISRNLQLSKLKTDLTWLSSVADFDRNTEACEAHWEPVMVLTNTELSRRCCWLANL